MNAVVAERKEMCVRALAKAKQSRGKEKGKELPLRLRNLTGA
mgnify:CR=1 FL=1|jgi:hypothetical protein